MLFRFLQLAQGLPKNQGSNKAPLSWLMSSLQHSHQQGGLTLALLMKGFKTQADLDKTKNKILDSENALEAGLLTLSVLVYKHGKSLSLGSLCGMCQVAGCGPRSSVPACCLLESGGSINTRWSIDHPQKTLSMVRTNQILTAKYYPLSLVAPPEPSLAVVTPPGICLNKEGQLQKSLVQVVPYIHSVCLSGKRALPLSIQEVHPPLAMVTRCQHPCPGINTESTLSR